MDLTEEVLSIGHFIGGSRVAGRSGREKPVFAPATGEERGRVAMADSGEVEAAAAGAVAAQAEWGETSLARRTTILFRFRELLAKHAGELAHLITAEHGKILADAEGEVARGLENVDYACGLAGHLAGSFSDNVSAGVDVHELRQPLGVVVGITPFNFPVMVPLWMLSNAIACGNSFILKPSERDPGASLLLAELLCASGLPSGTITVLQGDHETVNLLLDHPDTAAVSFVGSTAAARAVYQRAATNGKRVQALGGAKNHMVVLPDADLEVAADAAVSAAYGSAGQRCMSISVLVAVGPIADRLVAMVGERAGSLRVGPGDAPASQLGPLISQQHRERVASYLDLAAQEGAVVSLDGRAGGYLERGGFFLGPSLVDRVLPAMTVYRDEIFGPVLCVVRVGSLAEAIDLIAANPYGNGAAIFTASGAAARLFSRRVDVGMVGVNVPIPVPVGHLSFGGRRQSLFGDSHIYGPQGIHFYTRSKVITSRWPEGVPGLELGFPTHS